MRARDVRLGGVHIPILGYAFRTRLCFGGRSSEHMWERMVTAVRELVRALHSGALAACLHWVDDLFDILSSREAALRLLQAIVDVARPFQFALSPAKVLLAPELDFMGVVFDCPRQLLYIHQDKRAKT